MSPHLHTVAQIKYNFFHPSPGGAQRRLICPGPSLTPLSAHWVCSGWCCSLAPMGTTSSGFLCHSEFGRPGAPWNYVPAATHSDSAEAMQCRGLIWVGSCLQSAWMEGRPSPLLSPYVPVCPARGGTGAKFRIPALIRDP